MIVIYLSKLQLLLLFNKYSTTKYLIDRQSIENHTQNRPDSKSCKHKRCVALHHNDDDDDKLHRSFIMFNRNI